MAMTCIGRPGAWERLPLLLASATSSYAQDRNRRDLGVRSAWAYWLMTRACISWRIEEN